MNVLHGKKPPGFASFRYSLHATMSESIFERRWTEPDGVEFARQLVAGKVHPDSVSAMMDMGSYTGWHTGLIRELVRLGQGKRKARAPSK